MTDFVLCDEMHGLVTSGVSLGDADEQRQQLAVLLHELLDVALFRRRRPVNQLVHRRRHRQRAFTHRQLLSSSSSSFVGIIIHKTFIVRLLQTSCKNKMCLVLVKLIKVFSSFSYIFIVLLYYYHYGDWRIKMNIIISLV